MSHPLLPGVVCFTQPPPPEIESVRLVNGPNASSGRLEVKRWGSPWGSGIWGTVCDNYWNDWQYPNSNGIKNANVVCKMLGFNFGGKPVPLTNFNAKAKFGVSTLEMILDEVRCDGSESHLADCPRR